MQGIGNFYLLPFHKLHVQNLKINFKIKPTTLYNWFVSMLYIFSTIILTATVCTRGIKMQRGPGDNVCPLREASRSGPTCRHVSMVRIYSYSYSYSDSGPNSDWYPNSYSYSHRYTNTRRLGSACSAPKHNFRQANGDPRSRSKSKPDLRKCCPEKYGNIFIK